MSNVFQVLRSSLLQTRLPVLFSNLRLSSAPQPPKRPLNAYTLFLTERRSKFASATPTEAMKLVGAEWRALPTLQRALFVERAKHNAALYNDALRQFNAALTPEQTQQIEKERREARVTKAKTKLRALYRRLNRPQKPRSAFHLFIATRLAAETQRTLATTHRVVREYKTLNAAQKQAFEEKAAADKVRYGKEIVAWEKQLSEEDRKEIDRLTRKATVKKIVKKVAKKVAKPAAKKAKKTTKRKVAKKATKKVAKKA